MAKETAQHSKFVTSIVNKAKGDKVVETAERNERLAKSAISGQLSALEGKLVEKEIALENAKRAYNDSVAPVDLIVDAKGYISNVSKATGNVLIAEDEVEDIKSSMEVFKSILNEVF